MAALRLPPPQRLPAAFTALYVLAVTEGAFVGGSWALFGIAGGIIVFALIWRAQGRAPRLDRTLAIFTAVSLGVVALLNLRSSDPPISWHMLWQQSTIMIPLLLWFGPEIPDNVYSAKFFSRVAAAAFAGALALGVELTLGAPLLHLVKGASASITEYNRGVSYLAVIAIPLIGYLWINGRRGQAIIFVAVLILPFSLTDSRATKVAFLLGLAVSGAALLLPRVTKWALVATLLALLSIPFEITRIFLFHHAWLTHAPPSWIHRVEIWDYMSYRLFERPWLGWGMGTSRLLPYGEPHGASYIYVVTRAGHPHDAILQLWVELGLPGLALGVVFALLMLHKASCFPRPIVPFAFGAWTAALAISAVAYNFWDDSLFSLFALTALSLKMLSRQIAAPLVQPAAQPAPQVASRSAETASRAAPDGGKALPE
jgi:O-antigen ligase